MLYSIHGFSQRAAVKLGLDDRDLLILRWFVQFKDSGSMASEIINNDKYYWIDYEKGLCKDLPILSFKKDTFYRRLKKLSLCNVLKHETVKRGGTYSFYTLGDSYRKLIDDSIGCKSEKSDTNPNPTDTNPNPTDTNPNPTDLNPEQNTIILNTNTKLSNYISTTQTECKIPVVNTNKELIESKTHLLINSSNKKNKIVKWDKDRLEVAIEIFKDKDGKYFSLLEKIYQDDGNFIKKEAPQNSGATNTNVSICKKDTNIPKVKTRFHNVNNTFEKYTEKELEELLLENQKAKFG